MQTSQNHTPTRRQSSLQAAQYFPRPGRRWLASSDLLDLLCVYNKSGIKHTCPHVQTAIFLLYSFLRRTKLGCWYHVNYWYLLIMSNAAPPEVNTSRSIHTLIPHCRCLPGPGTFQYEAAFFGHVSIHVQRYDRSGSDMCPGTNVYKVHTHSKYTRTEY